MAYNISNYDQDKPEIDKPKQAPKHWWSSLSENLVVSIATGIVVVLVLVFGVLLYKHLNVKSPSSKTPSTVSLNQSSAKSSSKTAQATSKVLNAPKGVSTSVYDSIIASINSRNVTGLKERFAKSVKIVDLFNGSNKTYSGSDANQELAILLDGASAPWDWGVPLSELTGLENGPYGQYFNDNDIIGTSTNGYTISVQLDPSGDIVTVFIAPTSTVDSNTTSSDTGAYHPVPSDTGDGGD